MQISFNETSGHTATYTATYTVPSHSAEPGLLLNVEELGTAGQGYLKNLVRVRINRPDGSVATAWLAARLNARGQAQFELSTEAKSKTIRARVTAAWRVLLGLSSTGS